MPASRRYAFHKGKLFIEEGHDLLMVNPWPTPWAKIRPAEATCWKPTTPDFPVVAPVRRPPRAAPPQQLDLGLQVEATPTSAEKRRLALARFRACLPRNVARLVEPIRSLQWQHLVACAMADRFADLVDSNPVLSYLWIRGRADRLDPQQVRAASETPQRELLRELRLLHSKAAVKFLRKCYAPALNAEMAEGLTAIMGSEESLTRLHHVVQAGVGLVALARSPRLLACCSATLLDEVAQAKDELYRAPTAMRIENHLEMGAQLEIESHRVFRSRDELHRVHRDLVRDYQQRQRTQGSPGDGRFGLPPFPGTQAIQPLTTPQDLRYEGEEQDNCVGSYTSRVHAGSHYIYRVLWPQRCTLSIVKGHDGRWWRGELETRGNRPASAPACQCVDSWLAANQRLLRPDA